jgi:hypothetical protein
VRRAIWKKRIGKEKQAEVEDLCLLNSTAELDEL